LAASAIGVPDRRGPGQSSPFILWHSRALPRLQHRNPKSRMGSSDEVYDLSFLYGTVAGECNEGRAG